MKGLVGQASLMLTARVTYPCSPVRRRTRASTAPDAAGGAERPGTVDVLELADGQAAAAHLGEQALLAGVAFDARVGQGVDDRLRAEVGGARGGGVVAVTGRGRARLEVLRQRVAVVVGEGLADQLRADDLAV